MPCVWLFEVKSDVVVCIGNDEEVAVVVVCCWLLVDTKLLSKNGVFFNLKYLLVKMTAT